MVNFYQLQLGFCVFYFLGEGGGGSCMLKWHPQQIESVKVILYLFEWELLVNYCKYTLYLTMYPL